ncbi:MAG: ATPase [Rubrimonas sp.]|uniref:ATPase n=1 Tax=Rubrimonas sp. TaxID=2036015 RepID=UPI002FDE6FB5
MSLAPRLADPDAYLSAPRKAVALIGMSGVGKTSVAQMLRRSGGWFHYSVDYRIGTRYMGEHIVDEFKRAAMRTPLLRELLMSDSIYIGSNITFENLAPLSTYLGKPGDPDKGGLPFEDYVRRQRQHREAEIAALLDAPDFIVKAREIYGYAHFLCDTGGSICEVVDPEDPTDPVLVELSDAMLLVRIRETDAMADELRRRFDANPKPMYYDEGFLRGIWAEYLDATRLPETQIDPDAFIRWGFSRLLERRRPIYEAIARNWGVTVEASEIAALRAPADFDAMIARALDRRGGLRRIV